MPRDPAQKIEPTPHAVIYPEGMFAGDGQARLDKAKATFEPALGVRLHIGNQGTFRFATPVLGHAGRELMFPKDSELVGVERYVWFTGLRIDGRWQLGDSLASYNDEPGAVKFGFLRSEVELRARRVAQAAARVEGVGLVTAGRKALSPEEVADRLARFAATPEPPAPADAEEPEAHPSPLTEMP